MPDFITDIMKYRQKRERLKRVLSLVFKILVILEKLLSFNFKSTDYDGIGRRPRITLVTSDITYNI